MTALATAPKTRTTKSRAKTTPTATSPQSDTRLFVAVAELLRQAWLASAPHDYSGESDRLLRTAAVLAECAPEDEPAGQSQNRAFDIAACINAARLVPGDTESAERSAYLAQVGVILAEIAEATPDDILRTNVPRPALPSSKAKKNKPRLDYRYMESLCHFGCALAVLEMHAEAEGKPTLYGLRDLVRMYHDKADGSGKSGEVMQRDLDDLSANLEVCLDLVGHTLLRDGFDSMVFHSVDYLLRDAKAIADGERDQAKEVGNA